MSSLIMIKSPEDLIAIEDFSADNIKQELTQELIDKGFLDEDNRENFVTVFSASREPSAIYTYIKHFLDDEDMKGVIKTFISSVCEYNFLYKRHLANSYKDLLTLAQKQSWETSSVEQLHDGSFVVDTEDWQDLFLCGTEVLNSCQRVDGMASHNRCLMGYVQDGKCRMICVKNAAGGPIIARCMLKLIKDPEGKAVLLLEKIYPNQRDDSNLIKIREFALSKAESMGLDLYEIRPHEEPIVVLESDVTNPALFEYEDGSMGAGITNGIYSVNAEKIS